MNLERRSGGKDERPKETAGDVLKRFLADENGPTPPEPAMDALPIKSAARGAALVGALALAGTQMAPKADASPMTAQTFRTSDQQALDRMITDIDRSPDQRSLDSLIENLEHVPIDNFGPESFEETELKCLTDNVYHEARGEPPEGRYAVMFATLERVLDKRYPKTICGVVHQPWQFSWAKDKKILAQPINPRTYLKISIEVHSLMKNRSVGAAAAAARMKVGLPGGAIFYKKQNFTGSDAVEKFFAKLVHVATVGTHDFFVEKVAELQRLAQTTQKSVTPPKTVPLPVASPLRRQRQAGRNPGS